ncbi:MAG: lipase family protein [Pirellulaceae bacterium]|nr:lipase family protein [Pirellulaceae bacterium]
MSQIRLMPYSTSFDIGNAVALVRASELSYEEPGLIEAEAIREWGYDRFHFVDAGGTQVFLAANDDCVLVCFRGTEVGEIGDWITDTRMKLVAGPMNGKVHAGFYDALSKVWQVVDDILRRLDPRGSKAVFLTGHSLGAALATLAAARWHDIGRRVKAVYTFGQPRTGDHSFARNFNFAFMAATFRIVNQNDLVTRIPPRSFGYSHLGTFKYITSNGQLASNIQWWQRFLDSWNVAMDNVFQWAEDGVGDHRICQYRSFLENQIRPTEAVDLRANLRRFLRTANRLTGITIRPRRVA